VAAGHKQTALVEHRTEIDHQMKGESQVSVLERLEEERRTLGRLSVGQWVGHQMPLVAVEEHHRDSAAVAVRHRAMVAEEERHRAMVAVEVHHKVMAARMVGHLLVVALAQHRIVLPSCLVESLRQPVLQEQVQGIS